MSIQVNYLTQDQLDALVKEGGAASMLCLIGYDAPCPSWVPMGCPFSQLEMRPLTKVIYEVWTATGTVRYDAARHFAVARSSAAMMALIDLEQLGSQNLGDLAREAYRRIFDITDGAEQSIFRVWNYIPDITGIEEGLERYRSFNVGRSKAFEADRGAPAIPPAASALGSKGYEVLIYFVGGEGKSVTIENPRQVSAYHYPEQYGPRSPSFSRATLAQIGNEKMLFISGTASIVGHESVHPGNVMLQLEETIVNLRTIIGEAEKNGFTFSDQKSRFKVYLREEEHLEVVQAILARDFPELGGVLYLSAEICRKELLIEIEAACLG